MELYQLPLHGQADPAKQLQAMQEAAAPDPSLAAALRAAAATVDHLPSAAAAGAPSSTTDTLKPSAPQLAEAAARTHSPDDAPPLPTLEATAAAAAAAGAVPLSPAEVDSGMGVGVEQAPAASAAPAGLQDPSQQAAPEAAGAGEAPTGRGCRTRTVSSRTKDGSVDAEAGARHAAELLLGMHTSGAPAAGPLASGAGDDYLAIEVAAPSGLQAALAGASPGAVFRRQAALFGAAGLQAGAGAATPDLGSGFAMPLPAGLAQFTPGGAAASTAGQKPPAGRSGPRTTRGGKRPGSSRDDAGVGHGIRIPTSAKRARSGPVTYIDRVFYYPAASGNLPSMMVPPNASLGVPGGMQGLGSGGIGLPAAVLSPNLDARQQEEHREQAEAGALARVYLQGQQDQAALQQQQQQQSLLAMQALQEVQAEASAGAGAAGGSRRGGGGAAPRQSAARVNNASNLRPAAMPADKTRAHLLSTLGHPAEKVERPITNGTYITRLHVTQQMAQLLFPVAPARAAKAQDSGGNQYNSLFKHRLSLVDEEGQGWPVQYEGFLSSGQRHHRLTSGWSGLMRSLNVAIGDSLVLERWTEDRSVIHIRIVRKSDADKPPTSALSGRGSDAAHQAASLNLAPNMAPPGP